MELIGPNIRRMEGDIYKTKVLFVCVHNAARSQIAEAFMNHLCGDAYEGESAGFKPGVLNPLAVEAMKEVGIDISGNETKNVFDFFKQGKLYGFVITVCDESSAEVCPIFPGITAKLHWSFDDPSRFTGSHEERLEKMRKVRDQIRDRVRTFCAEHPAIKLT
jgi:arsenate reductase (thioredoxin)